jgi:hypothetical protein
LDAPQFASDAKGAALWSVLADSRVVLAAYRLLQFADGVALRPNPE